jgi:pilus assembly protein Flp/PilA
MRSPQYKIAEVAENSRGDRGGTLFYAWVIPPGYRGYLETLEGAIVAGLGSGQAGCGAEVPSTRPGDGKMRGFLGRLWSQEDGQDVAEYAVMLAVILVIVVGTVQLIGSNSNNVFSSVASSIGS